MHIGECVAGVGQPGQSSRGFQPRCFACLFPFTLRLHYNIRRIK